MPKLTKEIELLNSLAILDSYRLIIESSIMPKRLKIEALISLTDQLPKCGKLAAQYLTELTNEE